MSCARSGRAFSEAVTGSPIIGLTSSGVTQATATTSTGSPTLAQSGAPEDRKSHDAMTAIDASMRPR